MKKFVPLLTVLALLLSLAAVPAGASSTFSDVPADAWYAQDVADVQQYGIINGTGGGKFSPDGSLTLAEAITMAARAHAYGEGSTIPSGGSPWYAPYLDYAREHGLCADGEFGTDYNSFCNRLTMANLFSRVLPPETAQQRNHVTSLPDVQNNGENDAVFFLYQQGVLTGSDDYGTFHPYQQIKRSETAAILNRVLNPDNRKTFTLLEVPAWQDAYAALLSNLDQYKANHFSDIGYPSEIDSEYLLEDISGDGVPELLVSGWNYYYTTSMYALHTYTSSQGATLVGYLPGTGGGGTAPTLPVMSLGHKSVIFSIVSRFSPESYYEEYVMAEGRLIGPVMGDDNTQIAYDNLSAMTVWHPATDLEPIRTYGQITPEYKPDGTLHYVSVAGHTSPDFEPYIYLYPDGTYTFYVTYPEYLAEYSGTWYNLYGRTYVLDTPDDLYYDLGIYEILLHDEDGSFGTVSIQMSGLYPNSGLGFTANGDLFVLID